MKLYILDQVLEYENSKENIDNVLDKINETVMESNLVLSHLIVDEHKLYDGFYDYLVENIKHIEEIKVVAKTVIESSHDVILYTMDYIEKMIPKIEILSDEFYNIPDRDSWNKLVGLMEGFNWIIDGFVSIDLNMDLRNIVNSYEQWNLYAKDVYLLKETIKGLGKTFKDNDLVTIADILSYEVVPIFENMRGRLERSIGEEIKLQ